MKNSLISIVCTSVRRKTVTRVARCFELVRGQIRKSNFRVVKVLLKLCADNSLLTEVKDN